MTAPLILVAEDEPAVREMIAFRLERAGFDVNEAADCQEARRPLRGGGRRRGYCVETYPAADGTVFRVDKNRGRDAGGTGLGLAIVKHALQLHKARLEIRSVPGEGSTFICHFPRNRIHSVESFMKSAVESPPMSSN